MLQLPKISVTEQNLQITMEFPRTLRQERRDVRVNDRQCIESEFKSLVETSFLHGNIDVDLLTCGGREILGNSICPIGHSKKGDALKYPWVGASFYGNPEYITIILLHIYYQNLAKACF